MRDAAGADVERSVVGMAVGCPVALAVGLPLPLGDHNGGVLAMVVVVEHASDQAGSHQLGGGFEEVLLDWDVFLSKIFDHRSNRPEQKEVRSGRLITRIG